MKGQCVIVLLLFCIGVHGTERENREESIEAVIVLTRHGDRTPIKVFPNVFADWEEGLGQLTAKGSKQHFELGQKFRKKYIEELQLIRDKFHIDDVYVRSTPKERTLMSAHSFTQGLFHDSTRPWLTTVPINSVSKKDDKLLYAYKNCARLRKMLKDFRKTPEYKAKEDETLALRQAVSDALDIPLLTLKQTLSFNTLLKQIRTHNKPFPEVITPEMEAGLAETAEWALKRRYISKETGLLGTGVLLKTILDIFQDKINDKEGPELVLFSGHDGTILALLAALELTHVDLPGFAANVVFELVRVGDQKYEVRMLYNDEELHLAACEGGSEGEVCSFDEFETVMLGGYHEDWEDRCRLDDDTVKEPEPENNWNIDRIIFTIEFILGVVIGFALAWILSSFLNKRKVD